MTCVDMYTDELTEKICRVYGRLKNATPLVHVVTNFVVMNQTANALLALGASPMMSWAEPDAQYLSGISDALCINTGTPVADRIEVMKQLAAMAADAGKPVVLDPVGAGAGPYRTGLAKELNEIAPTKIIKGNASEICALAGSSLACKGVESTISPEQAKQILLRHGRPDGSARQIPDGAAALFSSASALVVSGETDLVLNHKHIVQIRNGSQLMGAVTGTGCMLSAICAAFYAVAENGFDAAVAAVAVTGIAGELAGEKSAGPGFFMGHFLDALYNLEEQTISRRLKADTDPVNLNQI